MDSLRNFSIIAHIDHGKSTLADRMLELTGTIPSRQMKDQVLDRMDLERERGITIKMAPVRMRWSKGGKDYTLNLIDTPGHVDFAYEVSRALTAVEGVILLVDSTQGVEAQTLSVLAVARDLNRVIIPVLSKVDAPHARVEDVKSEVAILLGIDESEILECSGKTGLGVTELLNAVIDRVPPPVAVTRGMSALVFDFGYSDHRGIIIYARMMGGSVKKGDKLKLVAANEPFTVAEVGVLRPTEVPVETLNDGEIGYMVTGVKEPGIVRVGDTVTSQRQPEAALSGFKPPSPVIWASVYPESQDDLAVLRQSLERLRLTDSSISYEEEKSGIMGRGFRCGFLGMLHLEIVTERLHREFNLELVVTMPTTVYEITKKDGSVENIYSPIKFPDDGSIVSVREQWAHVRIITQKDYVGPVSLLMYDHEAVSGATETLPDGRVQMEAEMPLREMMRGFFDRLKSVSSGFASLSYELGEMKPADVVRLDVIVTEELIPAFCRIVSHRRVETEAESMVKKLEELLPRQLFVLKIQAKAMGRIIASRHVAAMRKDVTGYLYGGDISRKKKLWQKQKEGKKRRGEHAKMHIPQEVFVKMMRSGEDS